MNHQGNIFVQQHDVNGHVLSVEKEDDGRALRRDDIDPCISQFTAVCTSLRREQPPVVPASRRAKESNGTGAGEEIEGKT